MRSSAPNHALGSSSWTCFRSFLIVFYYLLCTILAVDATTTNPTGDPTRIPSLAPTNIPTFSPSHFPSSNPSALPTPSPTFSPSTKPTFSPSTQPTFSPSTEPTFFPSTEPTFSPSTEPTFSPSTQPTFSPSTEPSFSPSTEPTFSPSTEPTFSPTFSPSAIPSFVPTFLPTVVPTYLPSGQPTGIPTGVPTSIPSSLPSGEPSSSPSSIPTSIPTGVPSSCPSSIPTSPTSLPTGSPSSSPSSQPSSVPTGLPSGIPTAVPSSNPTGIPSSCPTGQPSSVPTSQPTSPTSIPTSIPSSIPSGQPSSAPTSDPTGVPTSIPSSQPSSAPTSVPSGVPTSIPSGVPTTQPSSTPTSPTSSPTGVPTSLPSSQPSSSPTSLPSALPSSLPSGIPTAVPSSNPTGIPSSCPTGQPSSVPTSQPTSPTSIPTSIPSSIPSGQPSSAPTSDPTGVPTSIPSGIPSGVPTSIPTNPTSTPTGLPTSLPSGQPSSTPTGVPSLASDPRLIPCGQCQSTELQQCNFFTLAVVLECIDTEICQYDVRSFVVKPFSNIRVTNNCTLQIKTRDMRIDSFSSIQAAAFNIYASHNITLLGDLITSGEGPIDGPGSGLGTGNGGSYGGSGGSPSCPKQYFSNYPDQIGSVNVSHDISFSIFNNAEVANFNLTSGSGGGMVGSRIGGQGGGSILIRCRSLNITGGELRAEGGDSSSANLGSGSGGSITLLTTIFKGVGGVLSVQGGRGNVASGIAAGGGGRIYIQYKSGTPKATYIVQGGETDDPDDACFSGAAGSLLISPIQTSTTTTATLTFRNGNQRSWAVSIFSETEISSSLLTLEMVQYTSLASNLISLPQQCSTSSLCQSRIIITQKSVCVSLLSLVEAQTPSDRILLSADSVDLTSSSSLLNAYYIAIDSQVFSVDATSSANFGCNITIANTLRTLLYGQVNQLLSPSYCTDTSNPLNRIGVTIQGKNVTLTASSTQYLFIHANVITLSKGGYIGVPRAYNFSTCWSDINADEFSCFKAANPSNLTSTRYLSNSITLLGSTSITVSSSTVLRSSLITLCAPTIQSLSSSLITSDGLGCPHDSGVGTGDSPADLTNSGGGGGAYGGAGGDGDKFSLGGAPYGQGYNVFSVGSGAGTLYPKNFSALSSNSSSGGGIVILNATKTISINGIVSSGGANGMLNYGGGSGGLVAMYARSVKGSGTVKVLGGLGGPSGGGGGGGGRIVLQNPGRFYDTYQFPGAMKLNGGSVLVDTTSVPSTAGSTGELDFPICGPGYGNDYDTLTTCVKCPVGTYHAEYDGEECSKCKNKPVNAEYTTSGMTKKNCDYQCYSGYVNDNCITPFERFLDSMGGLTSFIAVVIGVFCLIFPPLYLLRLRRKAEQAKKESFYQSNTSASTLVPEIGASNWFNPVLDQHLLEVGDQQQQTSPESLKKSGSVGNLEVGLEQLPSATTDVKKKTGLESFQDLRIAHRMADKDLPHHAARVYLWGNNSPFSHEGGNWQMPTDPPTSLKNCILKAEYQAFARTVNESIRWNSLGFEAILYTLICLIFPPYSEYWMIRCRLKRAKALIYLVTRTESPFFKSKLNGDPIGQVRIGISPDLTVAYLDFVFDDGMRSIHRPLNKIGQPRFPLSLRICGLGTYFSPWYLDTNDILMQAISQSSEFAVFIDKSWINFVIELNNILKTMRKHRLRSDLLKLLRFLVDESKIGSLGGLIIQFCTFISEMQPVSRPQQQIQQQQSAFSQPSGDSSHFYSQHSPSSASGASSLKSKSLSRHRVNTNSTETPVAHDPLTEFGRLKSSERIKKPGDHSATGGLVSFIFGREHDDEISLTESGWAPDEATPQGTALSASNDSERARKPSQDPTQDSPRSHHNSAEPAVIPGNEFSLSYEETVSLLASGMRLPGLVIFHESTPLFEVVHSPTQPLTMEPPSAALRRYSNPPPLLPEEFRESVLDPDREGESLVDMKRNAREAYGDRADELAQFYRIVREADKSSGLRMAEAAGLREEKGSSEDVSAANDEGDAEDLMSFPHLPLDTTVAGNEEKQLFSSTDSHESFGAVDRRSMDEGAGWGSDRLGALSTRSGRWDHSHGNLQDNSSFVRSSGHLSHVNIWFWNTATGSPTQLKISEERRQSVSLSQLSHEEGANSGAKVGTTALAPVTAATEALAHLPARLKSLWLPRQDFLDSLYHTPFFQQFEEEEAYGIYLLERLESVLITAIRYLSQGRNSQPYSSPLYRKMAALILFSLIILDIAFSCVISINFWCIWDNYTLCEDHTGFILGVVVWPGALCMAPVTGLLAVAVNPTGIFARHYVSWSRLAAFSLVTLFTIYFYWYKHSPYSTLYYLLGMATSRFAQLLIADPLIASHESVRTSRGWGGLFTNILNDEYAFR